MDKETSKMKSVARIMLVVCISLLCIPSWPVYLQANPQQVAPTPQVVEPVARKIQALENSQSQFETVHLFDREISSVSQIKPPNTQEIAALQREIEDGTLLNLNPQAASRLLGKKPENLELLIPTADQGTVGLKLYRADISTDDFSVVTSSRNAYKAPEAAHYRGIVDGEPDSLAAISILPNDDGFEVMGFYSTPALGDVVIGKLRGKNPNNKHILYADNDLKSEPSFTCDTKDEEAKDGRGPYTPSELFANESQVSAQTADSNRTVRIYVEADYDIYQNKGSVTNVVNYVLGFFNQVATLYSNESIPIELPQLYVWDTPSPYTSSTSSGLLSQFQGYRTSFNGDLGHLIAFRGGGGIAAGFDGFCNSSIAQRQCFSGISPTYSDFPTYSWTVDVFTHEMGHLMGSRHTHACVWNGNNTAIDGCAGFTEGGCPRPGDPSEGGTIMSYCHLRPVGKNFSLGFGPQPGNVIRSKFNAATCLDKDDIALSLDGDDIALTDPVGWASVPVAYSNGDGSFTVTNEPIEGFATWASQGATKLTGDFNADGKTDIALTGPSFWGSLPVAFSNGDGSFTVTNLPIEGFATWASQGAKKLTGDFNADGRTDIALTGPSFWGTLPVAFSNGDGSFTVTNLPIADFATWASQGATKLTGDFNGDGKTDIALTGPSFWGSLPVAFSNGDGTFTVTNESVGAFASWSANPQAIKLTGRFTP